MPKRQSAYSQILKEKQEAAAETEQEQVQVQVTATPQEAVKRQNTVKQQSSKTAKITIYPTTEQLDKLYEFMEAYRKRTGIRINQQDIIRRMIDVATLDSVLP